VSAPHIELGERTFAPQSWFQFAADYPDQAVPFVGKTSDLTPESHALISKINGQVNQGIDFRPNLGDIMEPWRILPVDIDPKPKGDCHDYAVTKRALLMKAGWPSSHLLLALVVAPEAAGDHLILVVRTDLGDMVLDSLAPGQTPLWWVRHYQWKKIQSLDDPNIWCEIKENA